MGGLGVVLTRNIVYAAFSLLAAMLGVAGVFLLMFAEFLALVQVLIYGGAVVIVVLFSLMLTRIQDFQHLTDHGQWPLAAVLASGVFALLTAAIVTTSVKGCREDERRLSGVGREPIHGLGSAVRSGLTGAAGSVNWLDRTSQDHW